MPHNTTETAWRAEVFYGVLFLVLLGLGGIGLLFWRGQDRSRQAMPAVNQVTTGTPVGEPSVVRRMEVDGAPYLLWSNGQITPDMASHRSYILRTIAAQALLESQAVDKPQGR